MEENWQELLKELGRARPEGEPGERWEEPGGLAAVLLRLVRRWERLAARLPLTGQTGASPGVPGGWEQALAGIERTARGYEELAGTITRANQQAAGSIERLFAGLESGGARAASTVGGGFERMWGGLYAGLGGYAQRLGQLSTLSAGAFGALAAMNPLGAAAAGGTLQSLGAVLLRLTSGFSLLTQAAGGLAGGSGTTASSAALSRPETAAVPTVVNVYLEGRRSSGGYEVDRALSRAGVDRELRQRLRELARTGASPLPGR